MVQWTCKNWRKIKPLSVYSHGKIFSSKTDKRLVERKVSVLTKVYWTSYMLRKMLIPNIGNPQNTFVTAFQILGSRTCFWWWAFWLLGAERSTVCKGSQEVFQTNHISDIILSQSLYLVSYISKNIFCWLNIIIILLLYPSLHNFLHHVIIFVLKWMFIMKRDSVQIAYIVLAKKMAD